MSDSSHVCANRSVHRSVRRSRVVHHFSTLVSHPLFRVDPGRDLPGRDDGEVVLARARKVLEKMGDVSSLLLGPSLSSDEALRSSMRDCIFNPSSERKPRAYLVAPRSATVLPCAVDETTSEWQRSHCVVAIRESSECVILVRDEAERRQAFALETSIVLKFDNQECGIEIFDDSVEGEEEEKRVRVEARALDGSLCQPKTVRFDDVAEHAFLFDASHLAAKTMHGNVSRPSHPSHPSHPSRTSHTYADDVEDVQEAEEVEEGECSDPTQGELAFARFWRDDMKAASLVRASQPVDPPMASERLLCFDSIKLQKSLRYQQGRVAKTSAVGMLHASSSTCLCASHGKPECDPDSRSACRFTISMCGRPLARLAGGDSADLVCQVCMSATKLVEGVAVCCGNLSLDVACWHAQTSTSDPPPLSIFSIPVEDPEARDRACRAVGALISEQAAASDSMSVASSSSSSMASMTSVASMSSMTSVASMDSMDSMASTASTVSTLSNLSAMSSSPLKRPRTEECVATKDDDKLVKMLRSNRYVQTYRKSLRKTILMHKTGDGRYSAVKGDEERLSQKYRWMFPRRE